MQTILSKITHSFSLAKRTQLHIYEGRGPNNISGIRATIYGGTGFMGPYVGAAIGQIGSDLIFPHNHHWYFDDAIKELKLCAVTGQAVTIKEMSYHNKEMIDWTMKNSNVVINLLGPRGNYKTREQFEWINIEVPKRIAQACAKNENVRRFIHFSAAGASPDSESLDLQTKYFGEQEVLQAFPNATIFRPCTTVGMNDNFVRKWLTMKEFFYNFNLVWDDCKAKKQPISVMDVSIAVLNALKLPESAGKTYELGGPHVYSMLEIYEILHNYVERPPHLIHFPKELALKLARFASWRHFNMETVIKHGVDQVVSPNALRIEDLYVRPVSFPQLLPHILADNKRRPQGQTILNER